MLTEKNSKNLLWLGVFFFFIGIVFFLWQESYSLNNKINSEKIAQFGDFFGGIIGSIWSLAGVILFYVALTEQRKDIRINRKTLEAQVNALNQQIKEFELQREELAETRKVFIEQSETLKIQRFENTFFQLLHLHNEIIDKLRIDIPEGAFDYSNIVEYEKREVLSKSVELLKKHISAVNHEWITPDGKDDHTEDFQRRIKIKTYSQAYKLLIKGYEDFYFNSTNQILSSYYRNVYHIYKFIYKSDLVEKKQKQFYASLLRAQLSSDELYLILYNSLVVGLGKPKFLFLIKEFDIMQNFDFNLLPRTYGHKKIFEKELKKVKKEI
jgi:hypothetical protein